MAAAIPEFYASTLAISRATTTQDPRTGQTVETWAIVSGYESIPAAVAPATLASVSVQTTDRPEGTWSTNKWQVSLAGYYPAIRVTDRAILDDGKTYDIVGVESDSHHQMTRLQAEELR